MLGILIFSWIVSVLLVLLAERNNGYSSSLSHDEKIKRIREKLGDDSIIKTVRGLGYRIGD